MKILLILLGLPVWLPILISLFAVVLSAIASLWAGAASLWACFVAAVVSAPLSVVVGVLNIIDGSGAYGSAVIALGIGFGIAAVILFYVSLYATKGMCALTRKSLGVSVSIKDALF
jgi:hypothetical protein